MRYRCRSEISLHICIAFFFLVVLTSVWWQIGKYEIKNIFSKLFIFWLGIWVQGPYLYVSELLHLKFGCFGINYGIGRKYLPIWVLVSDLNHNSGFGQSLVQVGLMEDILYYFFLKIKHLVRCLRIRAEFYERYVVSLILNLL